MGEAEGGLILQEKKKLHDILMKMEQKENMKVNRYSENSISSFTTPGRNVL